MSDGLSRSGSTSRIRVLPRYERLALKSAADTHAWPENRYETVL